MPFTEVSPPDTRAAGISLESHPLPFTLDGIAAPQGVPAVHCGAVMQRATPA